MLVHMQSMYSFAFLQTENIHFSIPVRLLGEHDSVQKLKMDFPPPNRFAHGYVTMKLSGLTSGNRCTIQQSRKSLHAVATIYSIYFSARSHFINIYLDSLIHFFFLRFPTRNIVDFIRRGYVGCIFNHIELSKNHRVHRHIRPLPSSSLSSKDIHTISGLIYMYIMYNTSYTSRPFSMDIRNTNHVNRASQSQTDER